MKAWVATQHSWLVAELLPAYAHDLNPIEMGWGNVKVGELDNLCPDTIDEARAAAESGPGRVAGVADRDRADDQLGDLDAASAGIADPALTPARRQLISRDTIGDLHHRSSRIHTSSSPVMQLA